MSLQLRKRKDVIKNSKVNTSEEKETNDVIEASEPKVEENNLVEVHARESNLT